MTALVQTLAFALFAAKRLLTYLHIYQQEEYDQKRFLKWIAANGAFDKRLSAVVLAVLLAGLAMFPGRLVDSWVISALFAALAWLETDPRRRAKKKLVITTRARRIYILALGLNVMAGAAVALTAVDWLWLAAIQLVPVLLTAADLMLSPYENSVQKRFWQEAHDKLRDLSPYVIGITGSFGKTSVKHILGHILQATGQALITPGSVNTPMGITRIIREKLTPEHKYFIVEMGAYGPGSIERICRLTPPDMAVITAIGHAHYERFKSLDTVAQTKFELARAALEKGGSVITHQEVLDFSPAKAVADSAPDHFLICRDQGTDFAIEEIRQDRDGLSVDLTWQGTDYTLKAPLFGKHHGRNMALAFAAACRLGLDPRMVVTALLSTPQIAHRLEVKIQPPDMVMIDDAYNSNPKGFEAALDLVVVLKKDGGRGILITPGMVELGRVHDQEHARLGALAAEKIDLLLAVNPGRIQAFIDAYRERAGSEREPILCAGFGQAQDWLAQNGRPGDVVLMENDLPDLYERKLKI